MNNINDAMEDSTIENGNKNCNKRKYSISESCSSGSDKQPRLANNNNSVQNITTLYQTNTQWNCTRYYEFLQGIPIKLPRHESVSEYN